MTNSPHAQPAEAEALAFVPVVTASNRHDGWTPDRQRRFIVVLALSASVAGAAKAVGMSGVSAYTLRKRPGAESFAAAWDNAVTQGRDRAFEIAVDRAVNGVTTPRYYRGRFVGATHRYDHRAIIAALMPPLLPTPK